MPATIGNFHSTIQTKWHANIDLPCVTSGVPNPNVKWTFNGQPVDSQSQRSVYDNFTLHLESVTSADTGNFTCTAWNVYGSDNVTTSLLVVGEYNHNTDASWLINERSLSARVTRQIARNNRAFFRTPVREQTRVRRRTVIVSNGR